MAIQGTYVIRPKACLGAEVMCGATDWFVRRSVGLGVALWPAGLQKKQPTTFVVDFGSIRIRFDWM